MPTPRKGKDGWLGAERILKGFGEIAFDKAVVPVQRLQALAHLARIAGMYKEPPLLPESGDVITIEVVGVEQVDPRDLV